MTSAFERLLADLSEAGIDYILVGGLAVAFCGHVRATEDVDILVQVDTENLDRLLEVLADFGKGSATELQVDDFTLEEGAIRVVEEFPLDVFTQMSGYRYEDLESMTKRRRVNDHTIRHLNIEGVITLKEESLRQKDRMDVAALRRIQEEGEE
ncbi:MAG: nucleotidyltransferase [Salinibacter sp.]